MKHQVRPVYAERSRWICVAIVFGACEHVRGRSREVVRSRGGSREVGEVAEGPLTSPPLQVSTSRRDDRQLGDESAVEKGSESKAAKLIVLGAPGWLRWKAATAAGAATL